MDCIAPIIKWLYSEKQKLSKHVLHKFPYAEKIFTPLKAKSPIFLLILQRLIISCLEIWMDAK